MLTTGFAEEGKGGVFRVVFAYAFFAGLWILLSDWVMGLMFADPVLVVQASMFKGWLFVAVTSLLLYGLVSRLVGRIETAIRRELAAERERRQALELLQAVVDATDDALFAKDLQGRYLLFNRGAERMTGQSAAAVIGRDDKQVFPPEVAGKIRTADRAVLLDGRTMCYEETLPGPTEIETTKTPLRDAAGGIVGLVGIARDITGRRRAEEMRRDSEARLKLIWDHAGVGLARCSRDWRYLNANPAYGTIVGRPPGQIEGRPIVEVLGETGVEAIRPWVERVLRGESVIYDAAISLASTGQRFLHVNYVPERDSAGVIVGWIASITDLTDRRAAEAALQARNDELERFNRVAIGREMKVVELKQQINALSQELGRPPPHPLTANLSGADLPPRGEAA